MLFHRWLALTAGQTVLLRRCVARFWSNDPPQESTAGPPIAQEALHSHAVTSAGSDSFTYDAVGNQITRPGATLTYTPFDLPNTITQPAGTITFAYDLMSGVTEHRYDVHSPERALAIVTRGGPKPGTRYLHADHLGSTDVLTRENGSIAERRSYDPFGQRRNPMTPQGFTGHESDDELGLVNMKGRIYDPKVGRFVTTDPIVSAPLSGQSFNPYSYLLPNSRWEDRRSTRVLGPVEHHGRD